LIRIIRRKAGLSYFNKMAKKILKCQNCGTYTMKGKCPDCKGKAVNIIPAKFSPEDKYGKYRRAGKQKDLKDKGLL